MNDLIIREPNEGMQPTNGYVVIRDDRFEMLLEDEGNEYGSSIKIHLKHREHRHWHDWVEDETCEAYNRAYEFDHEEIFQSYTAAKTAALKYLRAYGAGDVEILKLDTGVPGLVCVRTERKSRKERGWSADRSDPVRPDSGVVRRRKAGDPLPMATTTTVCVPSTSRVPK